MRVQRDHPYKVYFGEEDGSFMAMLEYSPLLPLKRLYQGILNFVPGHFKLKRFVPRHFERSRLYNRLLTSLRERDQPYKVCFGEEDGSFMAMLVYSPLSLLPSKLMLAYPPLSPPNS